MRAMEPKTWMHRGTPEELKRRLELEVGWPEDVAMAIKRVVIVYQAGIANVFRVDRLTGDPEGRNARLLYQGDFRAAEMMALGLRLAGVMVTSMACNEAGDVQDRRWTDLDDAPFRDKMNPIF